MAMYLCRVTELSTQRKSVDENLIFSMLRRLCIRSL
jgi:hypothetical protein